MISVDGVIHAGDIAVTVSVTLLGYGLRRTYKLASGFLKNISRIDGDVDRASKVVDLHSKLFVQHKLAAPDMFPILRRRKTDDVQEEKVNLFQE